MADLAELKKKLEAVARAVEAPAPPQVIVLPPVPPKPVPWLFEIARDSEGRIVSMLASPVA
jgi:hypothetical protein